MQYMLMIYLDEKMRATRTEAEMAAGSAAYTVYAKTLRDAGAWVAGAPLESSSAAKTVRVANGKTQLLNGPYADTKEQLGGYFLIEAKDQKAAEQWAAKCPGASHGVMEVRAVLPM